MENEVKERLDDWRDGDDGRTLVDMLVKSILICNKYSFYNADGDWQSVTHGVGRALTGKCEEEFNSTKHNWRYIFRLARGQ